MSFVFGFRIQLVRCACEKPLICQRCHAGRMRIWFERLEVTVVVVVVVIFILVHLQNAARGQKPGHGLRRLRLSLLLVMCCSLFTPTEECMRVFADIPSSVYCCLFRSRRLFSRHTLSH